MKATSFGWIFILMDGEYLHKIQVSCTRKFDLALLMHVHASCAHACKLGYECTHAHAPSRQARELVQGLQQLANVQVCTTSKGAHFFDVQVLLPASP